jgi:hypothetical protein
MYEIYSKLFFNEFLTSEFFTFVLITTQAASFGC